MSRDMDAGDVHQKLVDDGYIIGSVRAHADGSFEVIAPDETAPRQLEAQQLADGVTTSTSPMTYLEALGRVALGTAGGPARAIVTAEVDRLALERNATRRNP